MANLDDFYDYLKEHQAEYNAMISRYRCAMMEVKTKFDVLDELYSLEYDRNPIETIKTRIKSSESLYKKLANKNASLDIEEVERTVSDIAGIRIICSFPNDIYTLADCLIQQDDITVIKIKDYVKNPKPSGYRSLHLIVSVPIFMQNEKRDVKVEVQLRTIAMDNWASLEHKLRYKKNLNEAQQQKLAKELNECAMISADLDNRMQSIHDELQRSKSE